jgi:hypothetical protein
MREPMKILGISFKDVDLDPLRSIQRYLIHRPKARGYVIFLSIIAMIAAISLFVLGPLIHSPLWKPVASPSGIVLGFLGIVLFSVALKAYLRSEEWEIDNARQRSERLEDRFGQHPDVFQIVQLTLSQLIEYYTINKSQARKSFNFSVIAIAAGLVTVLGGVWLIYSKKLGISVGAISTISGLLLQFFGGANFYIYNKSLNQMNYFYDRLMQMQDAMISIKVGDQISDTQLKDEVKKHISFQLLLRPSAAATHSIQPKTVQRKLTGKAAPSGNAQKPDPPS